MVKWNDFGIRIEGFDSFSIELFFLDHATIILTSRDGPEVTCSVRPHVSSEIIKQLEFIFERTEI